MGGVTSEKAQVLNACVGRYGHPATIEDAEFMAACREAVPLLLAHIESLASLLQIAGGFHDVAVKERDFERFRVNELQRIIDGLKGPIALNLQEEPSNG
jgi:hypothetical protein